MIKCREVHVMQKVNKVHPFVHSDLPSFAKTLISGNLLLFHLGSIQLLDLGYEELRLDSEQVSYYEAAKCISDNVLMYLSSIYNL